MDEAVVKTLIRFFYLTFFFYKKEIEFEIYKHYVRVFLSYFFNQKTLQALLEEFDSFFSNEPEKNENDIYLVTREKVQYQLVELSKNLHKRQKIVLLAYLLQFGKNLETISAFRIQNEISQLMIDFAKALNFSETEYIDYKAFISDEIFDMRDESKFLIISGNIRNQEFSRRFVYKEGINGQLMIIQDKSTNTYLLRYIGNEKLEMQEKVIYPGQIYFLDKGSIIKTDNNYSLYYNDIIRGYIQLSDFADIQLFVNELGYTYPRSNNGIFPVSFSLLSGQMLGIMGGSGTGKSTLINLLNGTLKPTQGSVLINGFNLHEETETCKNSVGYIPQDDFLMEELTVFQNLYINAKLVLGDQSVNAVQEKIDNILIDLDLMHIKDLKVGDKLKKFISGGERKRLNIAMELIREPLILIVDEPTSGLSSTDAGNVVELLKEQALKGKIVIVSIHQPSLDIFLQLDSLLVLDKGGYPIYMGNAIDSYNYFKEQASYIETIKAEVSGDSLPSGIFQIIESKLIDNYGKYSKKRKIEPHEWYKRYRRTFLTDFNIPVKTKVPDNKNHPPTPWNQFLIMSKRNLLSKIATTQFLILAFLATPLLAFLLSEFSKNFHYLENTPDLYYSFGDNDNYPVFVMMSVIVSIFIGLIVSAGDINRDRVILMRESYINLNKLSYLFSKISFLFTLSGIQTIVYVFISNSILQLPDMFAASFFVLFGTACFANVLGLIISSIFSSVTAIYIIVPLIIIPQILLSGLTINFNNINKQFTPVNNTPISADFMISRWAYEAILVKQFMDNQYMHHFYEIEKLESEYSYNINILIPKLEKLVEENEVFSTQQINLLYNAITELQVYAPFKNTEQLKNKNPDSHLKKELLAYFTFLKTKQVAYLNSLILDKEIRINSLIKEKKGVSGFREFKQRHQNQKTYDMLTTEGQLTPTVIYDDRIIRKIAPAYYVTPSYIGRSHFYASEKSLGNLIVNTYLFNILIIWLMVLVVIIILVVVHK